MIDQRFHNNFKTGDVVKIFYFNVLNRHRKIFTFVGICINYNVCSKSFVLQNFYGPEFIRIHFVIGAPYILAVDVLSSYNFKSRLSRMYGVKKMRLKATNDRLSSKLPGVNHDPVDFLYRIPLSRLERRRLRKKFRI